MKKFHKIVCSKIVLLSLAVGVFSCDKEKNFSLEMGIYTETAPFVTPEEMRLSTIHFIDEKKVVITRGGPEDSNSPDEFFYEILEKNRIKLTLVDFPNSGFEIYFRIINSHKFKIGYLHIEPGVGSPSPPMTFEKKQTISPSN